jgi:hypothetical protein
MEGTRGPRREREANIEKTTAVRARALTGL